MHVAFEMFVKTIVVYTLPAVPWLTPIFTCSDRVGQGPGPDGAAVVAGAVEAGDAGAVAVVVLSDGAGAAPLPAPVLEELPHAAARAATLASAAAANARRATRRVGSITIPSGWVGSVSRVTVMTPAPAPGLHTTAASARARPRWTMGV